MNLEEVEQMEINPWAVEKQEMEQGCNLKAAGRPEWEKNDACKEFQLVLLDQNLYHINL